MAIVFRNNPMPTTGALYVTNPRKKMKRIPNGIVHRYIYEKVFGKPAPGGRKSAEQVLVKQMIHKGTGASAARVKKAKDLYNKIVKKKNKTAVAAFEKWKKPIRSGQIEIYEKSKSQKKTASKRRGGTTVSRRRSSSASSASSSKSSALSFNSLSARQKKQVITLVTTARNADEFVTFAQSSKIAALKKATKTALKALYSDVNKRLKKLNPKRRNAMALAMRKNPKRKTSGKLGKWKGRMMKYSTFSKRLAGCGLTAKQKSALWTKYKKTGKLPALAKAKKRVVAKKKGKKSGVSQFAKLGVTLRRLGYKGKLTTKSLSTVAGRRKKIKALKAKGASAKAFEGVRRASSSSKKGKKLSAWQKFVKKHKGSGKTLKQLSKMYKKGAKPSSASKTRKRAVSQKKTSARRLSDWQKFLKKYGGRGLTRVQLKRLYKKSEAEQKLVAQRLKKARVRKGESKSAARARYQKRARGMVRQRGKYQPQMGPYLLRLNPVMSLTKPFASAVSVIGKVQDAVSDLPVVGAAAPYVLPVGLGLAVAGVHYYGGKYLGPMIQRIPQLAHLQHAGYTIVGASTALAIKLGQHFGLFKSPAANQIATLAVLTGSFVDGLDYFRSRGQTAIAGVHHTGAVHLGDGGQYFLAPVGQGTQAPVKRQMRQLAGVHSDYSAIVAPLSGASATAGAPMGYGALMYTGAGY